MQKVSFRTEEVENKNGSTLVGQKCKLLRIHRTRIQSYAPLTKTMDNNHPSLANGKVCYIEIPALDISTSASFYKEVFGWQIRQRGDGSVAFDDAVGQVSGTWVVGRRAATDPGLLVYIMVDSVAGTTDAVIANGGKIVQPIGMDAPEITARFNDPAGNVFGLYQQPTGN